MKSKTSNSSLKITVEFYDRKEKENFKNNYPSFDSIKGTIGEIEIPVAEFLTYYFFHKKRTGHPSYQDYNSIRQKIATLAPSIADFIDLENGSVRRSEYVEKLGRDATEYVGEAIGLAVANRIHGLTEADWQPIPEQSAKTLDYRKQFASDGVNFVEVETKGSSPKNNLLKGISVSDHKASIIKKKEVQRGYQTPSSKALPKTLRYGTVAIIDANPQHFARCLLVDPTGDKYPLDLRKQRLVSRLNFFWKWISFVSPRSQLAIALFNRIAALEQVKDFESLSTLPLFGSRGEPLDFPDYSGHDDYRPFFLSKSTVSDGSAGGVTFQISNQYLFFIGYRGNWLPLLTRQDFDGILEHCERASSSQKEINCVFSIREFNRLEIPDRLRHGAKNTRGENYREISLTGYMNYSSDGLVFGMIPLPKE